MKNCQRSRGLTTGRLDARFFGLELRFTREYASTTRQDTSITGPFTAAWNNYVRDELKSVKTSLSHRLDEAGNNWDWKHRAPATFWFPRFTDVEGRLDSGHADESHLKIEVENGLYDLATPSMPPTEYTMEHLGLRQLQKNIHLQYYDPDT